MTRPGRRFGVWLALAGLLLQVGLGAAHSARHFDHLVGRLLLPPAPLAATELSSDPGCPSPGTPASADLNHCAIGLGLAASGHGVLPAADVVPLPAARATARLEADPSAVDAASRRHLLPAARAPPAVVISA